MDNVETLVNDIVNSKYLIDFVIKLQIYVDSK